MVKPGFKAKYLALGPTLIIGNVFSPMISTQSSGFQILDRSLYNVIMYNNTTEYMYQ